MHSPQHISVTLSTEAASSFETSEKKYYTVYEYRGPPFKDIMLYVYGFTAP